MAQVLACKRTMVQNVPVLRGFAGDHTDLVSPFVMLDEFGPLQIDPGTLGMDIKAHPHAGWHRPLICFRAAVDIRTVWTMI